MAFCYNVKVTKEENHDYNIGLECDNQDTRYLYSLVYRLLRFKKS